MLANYNPDQETMVDCNTSGYIIGDILIQYNNKRILRPVVFYSKKITLAKYNYLIYNKELLIIIRALKK